MRSGLVRLMAAAVMVMASAVAVQVPVAAQAVGCPTDDCIQSTQGMRLHEDDWGTVQVWTERPPLHDLKVPVSTFDITTSPGDYRVTQQFVTIRAGQRSAEVVVFIVGDQLAEPSERFGLRIGSAMTEIEILDGQVRG